MTITKSDGFRVIDGDTPYFYTFIVFWFFVSVCLAMFDPTPPTTYDIITVSWCTSTGFILIAFMRRWGFKKTSRKKKVRE